MITLVGELLSGLVPLPVPASVYGMAIMFTLLATGVLKIKQIRDVAVLLIEVMAVMFVPSSVAIITLWPLASELLLAAGILVCLGTLLVMAITGHATQATQRLLATYAKRKTRTKGAERTGVAAV
ncbi:MAG: CidA/LrgA family protein [Propionibacteriaceae bacterium]|nr:CidA/LrgA family protein [Propionibacteriaceae bacterium]